MGKIDFFENNYVLVFSWIYHIRAYTITISLFIFYYIPLMVVKKKAVAKKAPAKKPVKKVVKKKACCCGCKK